MSDAALRPCPAFGDLHVRRAGAAIGGLSKPELPPTQPLQGMCAGHALQGMPRRACPQGIRFCNTSPAKCLQGMCAGHPFLQHLFGKMPAGHVCRASVFATPMKRNVGKACVQGLCAGHPFLQHLSSEMLAGHVCRACPAEHALQGMCAGHPFLQHLSSEMPAGHALQGITPFGVLKI